MALELSLATLLVVIAFQLALRRLARRARPGRRGHMPSSEGTPARGWAERSQRLLYHTRNLLVAPPLVYVTFSFSYETEEAWLIWPLGLGIVALGVALRVWAQSHIRFRLGPRRRLTTTGPYAIIRNPLYVANTAICVGATVLSELLWMAPVMMVWCGVVYSLVVRQEEARLTRKYGDAYREYLKAVPRWLPRSLGRRVEAHAIAYLRSALLVELPCLIIVVPFAIKEIVSDLYVH